LVYNQFNRHKMVRRRTDTGSWHCVIGGDIGTKNPSVSLVILFNDRGDIHVESESYARDLSSSQIVDLFLEDADLYDPDEMAIDPSGSAYIKQMVMLGYPAYKGNNDIVTGIQHVNSVINRHFTIDPSCIHTIAEFESYQYPSEESVPIVTDKPIKQNDHCMDALRYGIMRIHNILGQGYGVEDINESIEREYAGR
jgi:phage terminase large subunit